MQVLLYCTTGAIHRGLVAATSPGVQLLRFIADVLQRNLEPAIHQCMTRAHPGLSSIPSLKLQYGTALVSFFKFGHLEALECLIRRLNFPFNNLAIPAAQQNPKVFFYDGIRHKAPQSYLTVSWNSLCLLEKFPANASAPLSQTSPATPRCRYKKTPLNPADHAAEQEFVFCNCIKLS